MAFRIQIRRDTSEKWSINNPILLDGEMGYETDTSYLKIGDGTTPWNSLSYWSGGVTGSGLIVQKSSSVFQSPTYVLNFSDDFILTASSGNTVNLGISPSASGGGIDVAFNGVVGVTSAAELNFIGNTGAISVNDKTVNINLAPYYSGNFSVKLDLSGGDFGGFSSSRGPDGLPLTGPSWNFSFSNISNNITITHNTGCKPVSLNTQGTNGSSIFIRSPFATSNAGFALASSSDYNSFTVYGVNSSNTGSGLAGPVEIVWTFGATL